ncbi:RNA methyltransferase [Mariprofundus ferrooxydans]|nr:RNA methyltransferase [Mariprofundus ferrooxydans]MBN4076984.1 RNA methyltransferase [Mariprofundus ferrooxydans]
MGNLNCYAVVVPGLEGIAADELHELAADDVQMGDGGIAFTTTMDGLFRINLRARTITRILIRLASFRALSFPELYNKAKKVAWQQYIGTDVSLAVRASCKGSKLMHSGRAEMALADGIRDKIGFEVSGAETQHQQQILLRIDNNQCTISLDVSGERLDRRGYRLHSGKAPVRETIAAAILRWMDWQGGKQKVGQKDGQKNEPLLTPMCGSGTFAIEAVWMAEKRAAGLEHDFSLLHWPCLKEKRWQRALDKAKAMHSPCELAVFASEWDEAILKQAKENAAQAGLLENISFELLDARKLAVPTGVSDAGLIVCNPPYGERVKADVGSLYRQLGKQFKQHFQGWRMAVIVPDKESEKALALPVKKRLKIKHGGRWVTVLHV